MLTWQTVLDRTRRFLSDQVREGRAPRVTDQELCDAWIDAQDDLVQYVARRSTFTIDDGLSECMLPDDLYRVLYIANSDGWTMVPLTPEGINDQTDTNVWEGMYWYLTHDKIEFTDALDYEATVHYSAYYPAPTVDDLNKPIFIPRWTIQPAVYYVAAQCIEKQIVSDPQLRQYATRTQDSGTPISNPFLQVAEYLLKRYREQVYSRTADSQERSTWHSSYR
ncbi:MAG TPA: hypothetical protein VMY98_01190 [Anaerolineae bacterium]|nr:hypothetical protein [Anaerolineae bacterium]